MKPERLREKIKDREDEQTLEVEGVKIKSKDWRSSEKT